MVRGMKVEVRSTVQMVKFHAFHLIPLTDNEQASAPRNTPSESDTFSTIRALEKTEREPVLLLEVKAHHNDACAIW